MPKITALVEVPNPEDDPTGFVTAVNANLAAVAAAFENTVSRDGTAPNQLEADLEGGSNRIVNGSVTMAIIPPTLLMHFNGAEGSTTFTDSSPIGNNAGTSEGSPGAYISTADSVFGGASLRLDLSARIRLPFNTAYLIPTGDWTIEFWLKRTANASGILLDYNGQTTNQPVHISIANATVQCILLDQAGSQVAQLIDPTAGVALDVATHVAVVRAADTFTLYIQGVPVHAITVPGAVLGSNTANAFIGGITGQGTTMNGYMDEMRWTVGHARYQNPFTPRTSEFPNT